MKNTSIFRLIIVTFMTIFAQQATFAAQAAAVTEVVSIEQQKQLAEAFAVVKNATMAMDEAQVLLLGAENRDAQNTTTIIEQNAVKVVAEQRLMQLRDQAATKVAANLAPEGYINRIVAGAKNIGSGIAAYFTPGTGTAEQKETAKQIIKGLTEQEVKVTEKYALLQKGLAVGEQVELKGRYDAIIAQLETAIYEQQVITGDTRMGMIKRSLLLGAAAAGTAAMGIMLANQYFGQTVGEPTAGPVAVTPAAVGETNVSPAGTTSDVVTPSITNPVAIPGQVAIESSQSYYDNGPRNIGTRLGKVPGDVFRAVQSGAEKVSNAFQSGAEKVSTAFQNKEATPENHEEFGQEELAAKLRETIVPKIEEAKQAASEAASKFSSKVSGYFNGPAENREEEGITVEDVEQASNFVIGKIEEARQKAGEAKQAVEKEFEAKTGRTIPQAVQDVKDLAADKIEQVKRFGANARETIEGMLPESPTAKADREMEEMERTEAAVKQVEEVAAKEASPADKTIEEINAKIDAMQAEAVEPATESPEVTELTE